MEDFSVEYYETEGGTRTAEEFILSQDNEDASQTVYVP